jgi:hypothetical protein
MNWNHYALAMLIGATERFSALRITQDRKPLL